MGPWATLVGTKPTVGYEQAMSPPRQCLHCPKPLSFKGPLRVKWQVVGAFSSFHYDLAGYFVRNTRVMLQVTPCFWL